MTHQFLSCGTRYCPQFRFQLDFQDTQIGCWDWLYILAIIIDDRVMHPFSVYSTDQKVVFIPSQSMAMRCKCNSFPQVVICRWCRAYIPNCLPHFEMQTFPIHPFSAQLSTHQYTSFPWKNTQFRPNWVKLKTIPLGPNIHSFYDNLALLPVMKVHPSPGGGGALECQGVYQARPKIHVIRVVFQDQTLYARTAFRGAKTCKIWKKGVFLVINTYFGKDMTDKLRKMLSKTHN